MSIGNLEMLAWGQPSWVSLGPSAVHNVAHGHVFRFLHPALPKDSVDSFGSFLFYAFTFIIFYVSMS